MGKILKWINRIRIGKGKGKKLGKLSYYCFSCLLGYSLVPFIIFSIPMVFFKVHLFFKLIFSLISVIWSSYVSFGFIKGKVDNNKIFLMMYPIGMFFSFFIFIFISRSFFCILGYFCLPFFSFFCCFYKIHFLFYYSIIIFHL